MAIARLNQAPLVLLLAGLLGCAPRPIAPLAQPIAPLSGSVRLDLEGFGHVWRRVQQAPSFAQAAISIDGASMTASRSTTIAFALGGAELTIGGVPAGRNMILSVQGLDAQGRRLPAARYTTTVDVAPQVVSTASIGPATTVRGDVTAILLAGDRAATRDSAHAFAARLDDAALQTRLDLERSRLGLIHPSLFNPDAIAQAIARAADPTATASLSPPSGDYSPFVLTPGRARLFLSGLPLGSAAEVWLDDPLSPKQSNTPAGGAFITPVTPGTWTVYALAPDGTQATAAVTVPAGQATSSPEIRLDLGHWEQRAALSKAIAGSVAATMSLGGMTRLVMAGGMDGLVAPDGSTPFATSSCYAFDGTQLNSLAPLPTGVAYAAGAVSGSKLYLFGGMKADRSESSDIVTFDGSRWTPVASISAGGQTPGLTGAVCAALGGRLFVFGGSINRFAQSYDPVTLTPTPVTAMGTQRTYPASVAYQGRLYVFGGVNDNGFVPSAEAFDPQAGWTPIASLPVARFGAQAITVGGQIYVIGGMESNRKPSARVDVYTPATDTWASYSALSVPRGGVSLGLLPDPISNATRLFVLGGSDGLFYQILNGSLSYEKPIPVPALEVLRP